MSKTLKILITGAARGIGMATAQVLANRGHSVVATDVSALSGLEGIQAHVLDVTSDDSVARCLEEVGPLDAIVNNAAIFGGGPVEAYPLDRIRQMFETNTRGPFLVSQAAYPHLLKSQGRIINIGSLGGLHPWATHGHYCTSKAALHMLTQTMAKAFAPEISVNCVAPGMIVNGEVDPAYEHFAQKTPMQRNGTTTDVAEAVLFFARGPHFITGQILGVDGGLGL